MGHLRNSIEKDLPIPMKYQILVGAAVVALFGSIFFFQFDYFTPAEITDLPETIRIPIHDNNVRLAGNFRVGTRIVDPPINRKKAVSDVAIMKYQVGQVAYQACVKDKECKPTTIKQGVNMPQVMISYYDALAYAMWFSKKTKRHWRLPTADEWRRAAGDKYLDGSFGDLDDARDPARRWLLEYTLQAKLRGKADRVLRPRGKNGINSIGIFDISANVWEWTDTCFNNVQLDKDGRTELKRSQNCAVRAVEGKHTAYVIDFIRDAKAGGCAVGIPPDYLGFRLVLDL